MTSTGPQSPQSTKIAFRQQDRTTLLFIVGTIVGAAAYLIGEVLL